LFNVENKGKRIKACHFSWNFAEMWS